MTIIVSSTTHEAEGDLLHLDAALWRAHRALAGHWLHALRGSLNGLSLNLMLMKSGAAQKSEDKSSTALRGQMRDLTDGLTTLLDQNAFEDSPSARADVVSILGLACRLVEPLARRQQVTVRFDPASPMALTSVEAHVLHGTIVPLLVDLLLTVPPRSTIHLDLVPESEATFRLDVRSDADVPVRIDRPFREAVARLMAARGGAFQDSPASTGVISILLPRSMTATSQPCPAP